MNSVRTVITAAGESRGLFLPAGFGRPKSLVVSEGREVLAHAIDSYAGDSAATSVAIHAGEDDEWGIADRLTALFPGIRVSRVPSGAKGALSSALIALGDPDTDGPLVVAAGDSMIDGGIARFVERFAADDLDSATIAFPSTNPRWSYLSVDEGGVVRQVAEKRVIGPLATTGVFYFRSARTFFNAATWCLVNNASHNGVFYVSTTLNYLVSRGMSVGYARIDRKQYRSWSLPIDFTTQSE